MALLYISKARRAVFGLIQALRAFTGNTREYREHTGTHGIHGEVTFRREVIILFGFHIGLDFRVFRVFRVFPCIPVFDGNQGNGRSRLLAEKEPAFGQKRPILPKRAAKPLEPGSVG